jgi:hypothetical protein
MHPTATQTNATSTLAIFGLVSMVVLPLITSPYKRMQLQVRAQWHACGLRVCGARGEVGGVVLDITGDQFGQPPIVVTATSEFHDEWQRLGTALGFAVPTRSASMPKVVWDKVVLPYDPSALVPRGEKSPKCNL